MKTKPFLRHFEIVSLILLLVPVAFAQGAKASVQTELHVSVRGNDRNPGTPAKPFLTLQAAQAAVRALRAKGLPDGGVTVWLHEGLYLLDKGFSLDEHDSGAAGKPVVYRAAPGEHPRLFGGVRLDPRSFVPVKDPALLARMVPEARGHIVKLQLGRDMALPARYPDIFKGNGGMVQLIENGVIMPLSRWPNEGYTTMASVVDSGITPPHGGTFHYRPEVAQRADRWAAEASHGNLWLMGFWRVPFETESVRVQSIDQNNATITLAAAVPNGIGSKYVRMVNGTSPGSGKEQYYAFNLLEEIDRPGEWSFDFGTKTIYFWPPLGTKLDSAELLLATLNRPVVQLNGANHVVLQGLGIEGGLTQAISITNGSDDLIAGCTIRNTGGGGVDIEGGARDRVQSNDLVNLGTYGIRMVAGDRVTLTPANLAADNNHIHHFGQQERITEGIFLGGVGNRATHNLIHDGSYNGIRYEGNDQYMAYNEIHHIGLDAGDLGAFYTNGDWAAQGNIIEYNFAHHSPNANGSYLDDGSSGRTTRGNIFYKLSSGLFLGGGHNNLSENNLVIGCKTGIHVDDRGIARQYDAEARHLSFMLKKVDVNLPPWSVRYPHFLAGIVENPTFPTGNIFKNNLMVNTATPYQLAKSVTLDPAENPVLSGNPNVTDKNLASALSPGSAFYAAVPGFKPIPLAEIGLRVDEYRKSLPTDEETGRYTGRKGMEFFDSNTDLKASDRLGKQKH